MPGNQPFLLKISEERENNELSTLSFPKYIVPLGNQREDKGKVSLHRSVPANK